MIRAWLIIACAFALAVPDAQGRSRQHTVSIDSGWSFVPADVVSVQITIDLPASADHARLRSEIRHQGAHWKRDGEAFDPAALAVLGQSLHTLVPVLGMHHCPDALGRDQAQSGPHLQVEIAVRTRSRGSLRMRSSSDCAFMLPWHVTNGAWLAASYQPTTGQAIEQLILPVCAECRMGAQPMPEPFVASREQTRFESLFGALVTRWKRLSARDPAWVAAQTDDLTTALRWMDDRRFESELQRVLARKSVTPAVRGLAEAELERGRNRTERGAAARVDEAKERPRPE